VAEGTSLLRKHTGKTCIVGSNPTASARNKRNGLPCGSPFFLFRTEVVGFEDERLQARGSPNRPFAGAPRQRRAPRARDVCVIYKKPLTIGRKPAHCPATANRFGGAGWRVPPPAVERPPKCPNGSRPDRQVRNARALSKPYKLFYGGKLYLEVTPGGFKLWKFKYRRPGNLRRPKRAWRSAPIRASPWPRRARSARATANPAPKQYGVDSTESKPLLRRCAR